ncbi:hypothetical protein ACBZ91_16445 [Vibrio natriegens]
MHRLLRRERVDVNHKRVCRLYCELGLMVRKRSRRKSLPLSSGLSDFF